MLPKWITIVFQLLQRKQFNLDNTPVHAEPLKA
jgi:hypothetical protein